MARVVWTIGYQGAGLDDVVAALRRAGVDLVLDVRDVPVSRRPGLSKTGLAAALVDHGIAYRHLKGLGNPKAGRDAAHRGDKALFRRIFVAHLATPAAQAALNQAIDLIGRANACLLCYERDPADCHRTIVARAITENTGFDVEALQALSPAAGAG